MQPLAAVLLRHQGPAGLHYDWMIESPVAPITEPRTAPPLWTWRISLPSWEWPQAGVLDATALGPHRRQYLTQEGPLGRGRGCVIRVDQGRAWVWRWNSSGGLLELDLRHYQGSMLLRQAEGPRWRATFNQRCRGSMMVPSAAQ